MFAGNTADPVTVVEQMRIVKEQLGVEELVLVGDRGMVKSKGKQALKEAGLRYITALTDPQIRRLWGEGTLQMSLFSEAICEVEADGVRYLLRKNEDEEARQWHRLEDKLAKLAKKVEQRHEQVKASARCQAEAGPPVIERAVSSLLTRLDGRYRTVRPSSRAAATDAARSLFDVLFTCFQKSLSSTPWRDRYFCIPCG